LRPRSCIIDCEAVACGEDDTASFERIRYRRHDASVFLCAFDLIELEGNDLRREPLAVRMATLASKPRNCRGPIEGSPRGRPWARLLGGRGPPEPGRSEERMGGLRSAN
jgi:hypothetical protein